jgi:hypothetical protein
VWLALGPTGAIGGNIIIPAPNASEISSRDAPR